jgi:hypothetical protein
MTHSPWAPPQTSGQPSTSVLPPPPPPPQAMPTRPQGGPPPAGPPLPPVAPPPRPHRRGFPWLFAGGAIVLLIAAIAATAAITYAVARNTNAPTATLPPPVEPTPQAPQFSTAEQNAAKDQVCHVFDVSTRGERDQGGVRQNGQPNLLPLIRTVNSVLAVQNALTPAVPGDVAEAARKYLDANLQLTTAAAGPTATDEVNRLNGIANDATYAFADVCGLPH